MHVARFLGQMLDQNLSFLANSHASLSMNDIDDPEALNLR